jgi:hypothetical protein
MPHYMKPQFKPLTCALLLAGGLSLGAQSNSPSMTAASPANITNAVQTTNLTVQAVKDRDTEDSDRAEKPSHHKIKIMKPDSFMESLVPLAPFVMVPVIIIIIAYARYRRHKLMNETIREMVAKGVPVTPELVNSLKSKRDTSQAGTPSFRRRNDLRSGLILIAVGAGLLMIAGKVGWLVAFIGAAFLVCALIDGRSNGGPTQPPQA